MGIRAKWRNAPVRILVLAIVGAFHSAELFPTPPEVQSHFEKIPKGPVAQRLDKASQLFLGAPYEEVPLGEGDKGKYDNGPAYRFDKFDCTTFVETAMALALAKRARDFEFRLRHIRYRNGKVGFLTRNHFPCADWIAANAKAGMITDTTREIGFRWGIQEAQAWVDKKAWVEKLPQAMIRKAVASEAERARLVGELRQEASRFAPNKCLLPYIPLDKIIIKKPVNPEELVRRKQEEETFLASKKPGDDAQHVHDELVDMRLKYLIQDTQVDSVLLETIPSGTILNIVRPGWKIAGTQMNITHQGFVIRKGGQAYFRHVSRTGGGRVKDVSLANYLRLCLLVPAIKGINLLRVNEVD